MKKCFKQFQCVAGSFFHNLISNQIETKQTKHTVDVRHHSDVKHCSYVKHRFLFVKHWQTRNTETLQSCGTHFLLDVNLYMSVWVFFDVCGRMWTGLDWISFFCNVLDKKVSQSECNALCFTKDVRYICHSSHAQIQPIANGGPVPSFHQLIALWLCIFVVVPAIPIARFRFWEENSDESAALRRQISTGRCEGPQFSNDVPGQEEKELLPVRNPGQFQV